MWAKVIDRTGKILKGWVEQAHAIGKPALPFGYCWARLVEDGEFEVCRLYGI